MSGMGEDLAAVFWFYLLLGASVVLALVFVAGLGLAWWFWTPSWLWLSAGALGIWMLAVLVFWWHFVWR